METSMFDEMNRELEEAQRKLKQLEEQENELLGKITEQKENVQKLERTLQSRWEKYLLSQVMELEAEIRKKNRELKMLRKNTVKEQRREEEEKTEEEQVREEEQRRKEAVVISMFEEINRELEEAQRKLKQLEEQEKELLEKITEQKENVQKLERTLQSRWEKYLLSQVMEMEAEIKKKDRELKMLRKNTVKEQRREEEEREKEQKRDEEASSSQDAKKDETDGKHIERWDEDIRQKENLVQVLITLDSKTPKVTVKERVQTRGIMAGLERTDELPGEAAHEQDRESEEGPLVVVNIIPSTRQLNKACQCPSDSMLTEKEKKEWRKLLKRANKELIKQKKKEEKKEKKKTTKEKTTERKSFWRKFLCF
ncbi:golgin subfamily A member 6-like protein 6 [Colossoma macropomum]|uniref:golgin subfamily A member 6-like protein 6 n=1 Tax=Colossoma macropomum TaxID=42526 RepID=UPI001865439F|nr:golgin subfamily A member 6-like protein 6 [Colossoma macropomum]